MLILSSLPSASTTTKKARRRLRPKDKTIPHPEVPQTILGKYVIYSVLEGIQHISLRSNISWFARRASHA